MSSKFSLLANAMPTFTQKTTTEQKVDQMLDYQVQLLDYLRYAMHNLDASNFNETGLKEILEPVLVEVSNTEGDIASLKITAKGLESTVSSMSDSLGEIKSSVTQTSNEVSAIVQSVGANGSVTAASIVAAINSSGSSVQISADHVNVSGFVTFTDLASAGQTTINGDNITTGEIRAVDFVAQGSIGATRTTSFVVEDELGNKIGGIGYLYDSSDGYYGDKLYLYTEAYGNYLPSVKVESVGRVSVESHMRGGLVYLYANNGTISLQGAKVYIQDNAGTAWEFMDGALYKNGVAVL